MYVLFFWSFTVSPLDYHSNTKMRVDHRIWGHLEMDSSPLDVMSLPAGQGNPSLPLYKHCQLQGEEKRVILSRPSRRKSHTHAHTHTQRRKTHTDRRTPTDTLTPELNSLTKVFTYPPKQHAHTTPLVPPPPPGTLTRQRRQTCQTRWHTPGQPSSSVLEESDGPSVSRLSSSLSLSGCQWANHSACPEKGRALFIPPHAAEPGGRAEHRAQSTEHRAQSTEHRAQSAEQPPKSHWAVSFILSPSLVSGHWAHRQAAWGG